MPYVLYLYMFIYMNIYILYLVYICIYQIKETYSYISVGEYFCYIPNNTEVETPCDNCFASKNCEKNIESSNNKKLKQLQNGWHIVKKYENNEIAINKENGVNNKKIVKYKIKKWTRDSHLGEPKRVMGDVKKTYEVIKDNGCNSYSIEKIPAYALVIQGIKEGSNLVIDKENMHL